MDFSKLPYETQFKYLSKLSFKDVIHYCLTGPTAYTICQTKSFWQYKARKTFGIDLDIDLGIDGGVDDISQYQALERLYFNDRALLIQHLIQGKYLTQLPSLIEKLETKDYEIFYVMLKQLVEHVSALFYDISYVFTEEDAVDILDQVYYLFEDKIKLLSNTRRMSRIFMDLLFRAVNRNKLDLIRSISRYYIPRGNDVEEFIEELEMLDYRPNQEMVNLLASLGLQIARR